MVCYFSYRYICACVRFVFNFTLFHLSAFSVWSLKSQISAVAGALCNLSAHCRTVFSLLDKKDVHFMGQRCPVQLSLSILMNIFNVLMF